VTLPSQGGGGAGGSGSGGQGTAGNGGSAGGSGGVGGAGASGSGGQGTGGNGGGAGSGGAGNDGGAGSGGASDGGGGGGGTNCNARFNFENGALYGTNINTSGNLTAFTAISNSGAVTLCGAGALEIDATFMGSSGPYVGGEVDIPLNGAEDLSGKTVTFNVRAEPPGSVSFYVFLVTPRGYDPIPGSGFPIRLTGDQWNTASYTFPVLDGGTPDGAAPDGGLPDGGVQYMWMVYRLALQAFSYNADASVTIKIYVDEVDIR
jgi:hypothetical protein